MKIEPSVSIIMPTYNGLDHLKKCLPTLFRSTYKNFQLILVDNNSKDGSVEYVEKKFPKVKIVKNKKNDGYAKGNNLGWKYVLGKYVLFLSNDTEVKENFIIEMVKVLESRSDLGGVQSKVYLMDDHTRLDSVGSFLTSTGFLYHYGANKKDSPKYNKDILVYSAKGVCMMFQKKVIDKVLLNGEIFDSSYFAYFEETDLCHRVWLSGYKIGYAPKSVIYHKVGGTSVHMDNVFIQYHSFKNRINSYIKNLDGINLLKILPLHILLCELNAVIYLFRGKFRMFMTIQKSILWNISNLGKTLKKRKYVQKKIRKVKDSEIMPYIKKNVGIDYYVNLFSGLRKYKEKAIS